MDDKKRMVTTRINEELLEKLKILAVRKRQPMNALLESAIRDLLTNEGVEVDGPASKP